jgi:hypothetical protein
MAQAKVVPYILLFEVLVGGGKYLTPQWHLWPHTEFSEVIEHWNQPLSQYLRPQLPYFWAWR